MVPNTAFRALAFTVALTFVVACGAPAAGPSGPAGQTGPAGSAGPPGPSGAPGVVPAMSREFDIQLGEIKSIGEVEEGGKTVDKLTGEIHAWEPPVLVVFAGDKVKINVTNPRSKIHSFAIPAFKVDTGPLTPRTGKASVEFTADKAGIYRFQCNTDYDAQKGECEIDHKFQTGSLIVLARQ